MRLEGLRTGRSVSRAGEWGRRGVECPELGGEGEARVEEVREGGMKPRPVPSLPPPSEDGGSGGPSSATLLTRLSISSALSSVLSFSSWISLRESNNNVSCEKPLLSFFFYILYLTPSICLLDLQSLWQMHILTRHGSNTYLFWIQILFNTFLLSLSGVLEPMQYSQKVQTLSSGSLGRLNCTSNINGAQKSIWIQNHYVFDPSLILTPFPHYEQNCTLCTPTPSTLNLKVNSSNHILHASSGQSKPMKLNEKGEGAAL